MRAYRIGAVVAVLLGASTLAAQTPGDSLREPRPIQLSGWLEAELRLFPQAGLYDAQGTVYPALGGEMRLAGAVGEGKHRWAITAFARGDADDHHRSHVELRETSWTWQPAAWQLRGGMLMEFWGVTES